MSYRQLSYLARTYFHQDYDLESPTPLEVIRAFRRDESPEIVSELISGLKSVLNSGLSEKEIADLWVKEYRASYDPHYDHISYREWFAEVLEILEAT